jgi:phage major head subunit gpT-like protein
MGVEYNLISKDAQRALEEFAQDFAAALTQPGVEPWARNLGLYRPSRALKTTYPIPVSAAGYNEFKGDIKYRGLFEKSLELMPKTWQDGVSELASVIEAPDFIGWTGEPAAMAAAAMSLPNEIICDLLAANPACWTGKNFFASDHPVNVFDASVGTFDNDITGAGTDPTIGNLKIAKETFRSIKAANGKPLGLRMTHVFAPAAQEEIWRDLLERDLILEKLDSADDSAVAMPNRHKGTVALIISDELADDTEWYALALNKPGMYPWIIQDEGAPEEIRSDKDSHLYKTTLKVGLAYVLRGNGALALPHCVQRWAGTAP